MAIQVIEYYDIPLYMYINTSVSQILGSFDIKLKLGFRLVINLITYNYAHSFYRNKVTYRLSYMTLW